MEIRDIKCNQYMGIRADDTDKYLVYINVELKNGILSIYVRDTETKPLAYMLGFNALEFRLKGELKQ